MQQNANNPLRDLSFRNKCMIAILVMLTAAVFLDFTSHNRTYKGLHEDMDRLSKTKEQALLLENLYHTLEEKQASMTSSLVFFDPQEQARMKTMSQKDIVRYLATKNGLRVDWIDEILDAFYPDDANRQLAVSLQGDFEGLKAFLLDLTSWPRLRKQPLLQVFAGHNELDILVTIQVERQDRGDAEGRNHE